MQKIFGHNVFMYSFMHGGRVRKRSLVFEMRRLRLLHSDLDVSGR